MIRWIAVLWSAIIGTYAAFLLTVIVVRRRFR